MEKSLVFCSLVLACAAAFGEKVAVCTTSDKIAYQGIAGANAIKTNCFTIEAWVKPTAVRGELPIVTQYPDKGRIIFGLRPDSDEKNLLLGFFVGNYSSWTISDFVVPLNEWTHVAVTRTARDIVLYANGEVKFTYTYTKDYPKPPTTPLTVGGYRSGLFKAIGDANSYNTFPGNIADVRVWNFVRTQAEIAADKDRRLTGGEEGLVAYWPLNEMTGNTTPEYVTGANELVMDVWTIGEDDSFSLEPAGGIRTATPTWPVLCGTSSVKRSMNAGFALGAESDFTLEAWINPTNGCNAIKENRIASQYVKSHSGRMIFELWYGQPALFQGTSSPSRPMMNVTIPEDTWTHVACVRKFADKEVLFYTNGVLASSHAITTLNALPADTNLFFLGGVNGSDPNFLGCLRDFRVWGTARTESEIKANFQKCLTGKEEGLLGCWPLDDGGSTFHELVSDTRPSWAELTGFTWLGYGDANATAPYRSFRTDEVSQPCFGGDVTTGGDTGLKIPTNTTAYTVEAWVCPRGVRMYDANEENHVLVQYVTDDPGRFCFGLKWNQLYLVQGGNHAVSAENRISIGQWSHIAISRSGRSVSYFINGELVETYEWAGDCCFADTDLNFATRIGPFNSAGNYSSFNGGLREVRVWTVARTAEEIAACYNRTLTGREKGLFAYWPMDNGVSELTVLKNGKKGASDGLLRALWLPLPEFPTLGEPYWYGSTILVR